VKALTRRAYVVEDHFGHAIADPYRWPETDPRRLPPLCKPMPAPKGTRYSDGSHSSPERPARTLAHRLWRIDCDLRFVRGCASSAAVLLCQRQSVQPERSGAVDEP
jgi:hypothetical protein